MPKGVYKRKLIFTPRRIEFIKQNRMSMSADAMGRKLGLSRGGAGRWLRENGLSVSRELQLKFRSQARCGRTSSTPAQDRCIRKNYLTIPLKKIAQKINRSSTFVVTRMRQLGLVTPPEIKQKFKEGSWIKKGNTPVNKGKKMSKAMYRKLSLTMFKKGNTPVNTRHDGAIVVRHNHQDRGERAYKWIRISLANWEMLHVYNWEMKYGPVPEGYMVAFKTNDTMNCEVENLEMITLADNMRRNTIHKYPAELKSTIRMLGKLGRKIKQHGKKQNQ